MIRELSQLSNFINDSVKPGRLVNTKLTDRDFDIWSEFIKRETVTLKEHIDMAISSMYTERLLSLFNGLVDLINITQSYTRQKRIYNSRILLFYRYTCENMERLLKPFYNHTFFEQMRISNFSLPALKMELKGLSKELSVLLIDLSIESELTELLSGTLMQRIQKRNLTWQDAHEIRDVFFKLLNSNVRDTNALIELLIAADFNFPQFFLYCIHLWRSRLLDLSDLRSQIEYIIKERHRVYEICILSADEKSRTANTIGEDLKQYLKEKQAFLVELLDVQRAAVQDGMLAKSNERFPVNLSVPQLGLFIRLQIEKGILPKENTGQLFAFFAAHFYTANALHISAESLQKKSTDIEFATAQKMKAQLIGMLNWLNVNYNVSNYS